MSELEITDQIKRNIEDLILSKNMKVVIVTTNNIDTFIPSEIPINPLFHKLSDRHKNHYIMSILAKCYGGGFTFGKTIEFDWSPFIHALSNTEYLAMGSSLQDSEIISGIDPFIMDHINKIKEEVISDKCFLMKPDTEISNTWYESIENTLKLKKELLLNDERYPLRNEELCQEALIPIFYSNRKNILRGLPRTLNV